MDDAVREGLAVWIRCKGCGRTKIVEARPLMALAVLRLWPRSFMRLGKHLRCGACRDTFPEMKASSMPPDAEPIGITTSEQFEREKRRLRG